MNTQNQEMISSLRKDFEEIRGAMHTGTSAFRLIYAAKYFRTFFLFAGIWVTLFSLGWQLLMMAPGSWLVTGKWLYFILLATGWALLLWHKTSITLRAASALQLNLGFFALLKELLTLRLWGGILPMILALVLVPIRYFPGMDFAWIFPYLGILLGLVLIQIGTTIQERPYLITGGWMLGAGLVLFLFFSLAPHLSAAIVFIPGSFLFVVNTPKNQKGENDG